tara:strand:+ start:924 stop:1964 length:1041 start_codon:yes stop_codon:yes gene_type:complete
MEKVKITEDELNDIFSIPTDMSHLGSNEDSHDVSYADLSKDTNDDDFNSQIKKMSSTINVSVPKSEKNDTNNDLVDNSTSDKDDISNVKDDISNAEEDENTKVAEKGNVNKMSDNEEKSLGWNFKTDDADFLSFYEEKKSAVQGWLLPFGEINFKEIISELNKARVDLSSLNYGDLNKIFLMMKEIQQWRDRVAQMAIRVNAQYYSWKRAVDLFIGLLAQYKYDKPAVKQDGVVYKHMGDMIRYYSQLESSHRSVEMILKNLDNAFECLSRQVTIFMPGKDHEDVEKRASKQIAEKNVKKDKYINKTDLSDSDKKILSDLDTVSTNKSSRNKSGIKTGRVDWNSNF